jgi:hypothetical protein
MRKKVIRIAYATSARRKVLPMTSLSDAPLAPCWKRLLCAAKMLAEQDGKWIDCQDSKDLMIQSELTDSYYAELSDAIEEVECELVDRGIQLEDFHDPGRLAQPRKDWDTEAGDPPENIRL